MYKKYKHNIYITEHIYTFLAIHTYAQDLYIYIFVVILIQAILNQAEFT